MHSHNLAVRIFLFITRDIEHNIILVDFGTFDSDPSHGPDDDSAARKIKVQERRENKR